MPGGGLKLQSFPFEFIVVKASRTIVAAIGLIAAAVSALAATPVAAPEADGRSSLYRPAAERASILDLLNDAQFSIRGSIEDLSELHAFDPAAPPDGSIIDALIAKAQQGVDVRVILAPGGAPEDLVETLRRGSVQVRKSDAPFAANDAETFVIDGRRALILSGEALPGPGHARDFAIESTEGWLVSRLARDFDATFTTRSRVDTEQRDDPNPIEHPDLFSPAVLSRDQHA